MLILHLAMATCGDHARRRHNEAMGHLPAYSDPLARYCSIFRKRHHACLPRTPQRVARPVPEPAQNAEPVTGLARPRAADAEAGIPPTKMEDTP